MDTGPEATTAKPAPEALALSRWQVRVARPADLDALLGLAHLTGGGFTNLPPERAALESRLAWSDRSLAARPVVPGDEMYMLVLEHAASGRIGGTACLFAAVGQRHPFYSYKLTTLTAHSRELGRSFRTGVLHLVNDFDGCSEVGGLFLHPDLRMGGLGRLLARSRYLFMARNRDRFAPRVLAELRGVIDNGRSPFWDGLAGRFFGMDFVEADRFNGIHGNQFIADMMPKFPVYVALLPPDAQDAIGREHPAGRPARRLLESEGFAHNGYVDIFDGGPTMDTRVADLRAVREAEVHQAAALGPTRDTALVSAGQLADFRVRAIPAALTAGGFIVAPDCGFTPGEELLHAPF